MGLKRLLRMERRADVGDAVLQAFQDSLLGGPAGHVDPTATASVETSIRALSSPYGLATVTGPAMITPAFLVDLARRLFTSGNAVYRIHVDDVGIYLVPASGFDVSGSSGLWVYELETPIPGQSRVARRRVAEDGVVHVHINAPATEPWRGRAPWQIASASAKTYAQIERSLGMDASPPSGMIMPQPDGASLNAIAQMKAALTTGKGGLTLVETTAHGFGQGVTSAPKQTGCKSGLERWYLSIILNFAPNRPRLSSRPTASLRPCFKATETPKENPAGRCSLTASFRLAPSSRAS